MEGMKIAVIGGGSSYTPELIHGIIQRIEEFPVREIALVDVEEGQWKLDIIRELSLRMLKKHNIKIKITSTLNRKEAIKDADFVVTQFRVGGLKARLKDETIPLKYNLIGQETTGVGGFTKALRTIPVILDICKDISELAPNAFLINFTNPAGIITETILNYTKVKAIGLCNVPITMKNNISKLLEVEASRIKIDFLGLNHMVYGKAVYLDGENITKDMIYRLSKGASINMNNIPDLKWDEEFLKSLNMIPCPYHRYFYMKDEILKEQLEEIKNGHGTRAKQVMEIENKLFKIYDDEKLDEKPAELDKRGGAYYSEAAVSLMSAIYNDKNEIHTVNIKNNGSILDLPNNSVIETNAIVNKNGTTPISSGNLPNSIKGLVQQVKAYETLTVEAAVKGDYNTAFLALINNPLGGSIDITKKLLKDILHENKKYLPQFK
ncbi:6-phospho-beta-glucosidase [uncultured Clostridium sp.]|uniref:6-phospho-beta-glucosidase n=1 Tax=uncultured Clostridium sp. TaxID=59620 RepID=UPI002585C00F|nr:6-phospho-beta-glucosidase [uncultured Clostridium sp.]MDU1350823.1 6-phospho-beta-glucosidase [Clostridium argentinense]